MRLHLPTRLRAAVLACFAVVTSFTTTLATGAIAGGAFALAIAGSQALAAYDEATATITGTSSAGAGGIVMGNLTVPAGQKLTFAINQDARQTYFNGTQTYAGDIIIKNTAEEGEPATGMVINDGNGNDIITFTGAVTGDGIMYKKGAGSKNTWIFSGDVHNYEGNIILKLESNAVNFKIKFDTTNNSTAEKGVSGTGDITFESDKNSIAYDYSDGRTVYVTNVISATGSNTARVALIGTDEVVFTKNVSIHELRGVIYTGNNETYPTGSANASRITFKGENSILGKSGKTNDITSTLEVAQGAGLTLAGTMSFASLGDTPRVTGSGSVTMADGFVMELGTDFAPELNKEYKLFADTLTLTGWEDLTMSGFVKGGRSLIRSQMEMTATGFKFTAVGSNYTDMTPTGNFTWNYTDEVWNTEQDSSDAPIAFAAGDSAVFSESVAITLTEDGVTARNVLIQGAGTTVSMTENGFVTVEDMLTVDNGATLTLNTSTGASGVIRGAVTVLSGGTLQFNAKDVTGYNENNTHTININEGGRLVLNISQSTGRNETFRGTLNLDGTLESIDFGVWDLYGGGAKIVTGENKNAEILTDLRLRQSNSVISVGSGSTLTLKGALSTDGNNGLVKDGAGKFVIEQALGNGVIGNVSVNAGTLELLGGGNVGTITTPSTNAHLVFGGNSGTTYTVGAWNTTDGQGYSTTLTVRKGVEVTMAANDAGYSFANNWGIGVLQVDGILTMAGGLYMHSGNNEDTTRNLITGSGVLNAASLTTSNNGTYNFSVAEMNVSGNTSIGRYVNIHGGTVNLNGNSGFFARTNIEGGTLNLVGAFRSNTDGVINVNSGALNIKSTTTSLSDDPEQNFDNTIQRLNVAEGAVVTVDTGAVATIAGATLAAPIINKGTLTLSGTLTVSDLSAFTPTISGGTPTYVDADGNPAENGYLSGTRVYTLIENTGTLNDDAITSVSGVTGTYADGVLTTTTADESTFYVNTEVDAAALGAGKKYRINGGTLNVGTDAANILKTAVGSSGILNITENCVTTGNDGLTTQFKGTLALASGVSLTLGKESAGDQGDSKVINTSSLTAVHLYGGSTLNYHGNGITTLKNLTVKDGTATLNYIDANGDNAVQMVGVTTLTGNLDVTSQFDGAIAFERLSGAGNMTVSNATGASEEYVFSVSSLQGYGGKLSLTKSGGSFDATVSTGTESVSFKGIAVDGSVNLALNVQSAATMSEGLSLSNGANATVAIATGASLAGAVNVSGAGNALTSTAGGMNLSQLNVAEGAALGLNGAVSALLMNQAGTVDTAGMLLTDGAVLTYGNAANLLSVADGMLAGNVVIGTGLTLTDDGVNLGLSSAIAQEKIGISNYANSALLVVGDTWYLKSVPPPAVRYYWEGEDNDFFADPNKSAWSTTDNDKSNLVQLPAALDNVVLVFSDEGTEASPNTMKLNGDKTVHSVEVSNGYYEFANAGKITCTELNLLTNGHLLLNKPMTVDQLSMAANSSLSINGALTIAEGGKVTVTGAGAAIELGTGRTLTADALDISIDGASLSLSGTGTAGTTNSVTVSSISLGADSGLELAAGTSNLTLTANSITHDVGSSISIGAGQVLDVSAYNYGNKGSQWAALLKAVSGAGTLILKADNTGGINAVIQPGEAVTIATNVEMSQLKLNYIGLAEAEKDERTLTIGSNGSLKVGGTPDADAVPTITDDSGADGVLICESGATVKVEGGRLSAEHIMLGHDVENHDGYLRMTSAAGGSITTGSITLNNSNDDECTFTMEGGTLTITSTAGIGAGVVTDITGGTLVASEASGWGMTGASVGGAAVSADSAGSVTMTNTTVTGDITGNGKLVLAGTVNATANATVSGASVGGITVTTTDTNKLTLNNTTIGSTITNNGTLEFSGTQNVTLAASSVDKYYDSGIYGDNGYKSTEDVYTLVSGTAASAAADTIWQVNGAALSGTHEFDGNTLTHITADTAGKVYYINSDSVEYKDGAGCKEAVQLQLTGGTLVMSQELNSTVTTGGIAVTGSSTTLELNAELNAENVSMGTGAATVLMGNGTLNLGTGTVLASGISLGTETDAEWTGTVKVTGAELSDANLSALGVTGSVIELNDTDGTLKDGTYTADVKLTNGSEVVLGANNSFASLDAVDGSLSIAGAGNSIVTLTMANDATLELDLNTAEVSDLKKWSDGPMLTVTTLDTATAGGKLSISALLSDEALLTLGNGDTKVLATINTCGAELDLLVNGSPAPELTDPNDGMQYKYTLVQQEGTDAVDIVISAENARRGWIAADSTLDSTADTTWANDDTADGVKWSGAVGEFYGEGYKTVTVEEGGVSADHVIVSANGDDAEYTFTGGEVSTTRLTVNKGELVIDNAGVTAEELVILAGEGKITLNAGKTLTVGKTSTENPDDSTPESGMTVGTGMLIGGTAELDNSGTVTVNGTLSISETAKVTNSGTLYAASLDASGAEITNTGTLRTGGGVIGTLSGEGALNNSGTLYIESDTVLGTLTNSGTLRVDGDLTVNSAVTEGGTVVAGNVTVDGAASFTSVTADTLKADEVTLTNGSISTLETSNLTVNTTGTVTVDNAVTLKQLSGDGLLEAKTQLTLDGAVAGTADVNTPELVLTSAGSSLGAVKADGITMAEDTTLSTEEAFLTVGSIASLSGEPVYVVVSESAFDAFAKQTDGVYTAADYLLVDGAASAEQFTYAQDGQLLSILQTGMDAGLTVKDGVLALSISEITNAAGEVVGMVWDTTEGNTTTNNGVEIMQGEGFYKALDYVQQVLVTEERTFDLSDESVGDSVAGNASDPVAGLLIRNLSGGGGLTVKGNSASQDAATLMNTPGRAVDAVALTADAATVNLGLPEDAEGYLVGDQSSTGPVLKSLSLVNRAAVNVNSNTEVLGTTDVADHTVLAVADGMQLTTGMLKGTDEARIRGTFEVTRGGVYTGAYEDAFIMIARGSELHLRMGGRRDLGLLAEHGSIVSLWSFGMDGRLDSLQVGRDPLTRALGGDAPLLDILNATASGDTITHSTLTVDEKLGNYINGAVVQISLGAAETAATALSRTGVPVVFDGDVDVLNSEIRVNMMGNTVKDGVLNIDTSADTDLTLARFVTGGLVSGNTVTLTGTPEMLALLSKYYTNARMDDTGRIKVDRVRTYYADRLEVSGNAQVGIDMADAALVKLNPQANRTDCQHLAGVLDALDAAVAAGDSAAAETLGAAVSGASVAALGAAVAGDVERQLMGIRNRTTTMGVDQTQVNENMPYFNAWINAEGDFRRVDADGTASGYELSSWGGTVGFDVDCTPRLTLGLAATAMYGDFTAKSADKAEGDLDTYYVTAFARYASNRWSHTFVATVGMADTSLKRTVSPVGYTAEGDSEATTFGFLYELGYVAAMNESATACLQPVFNVMLTHSSLDGCTEEGTDAALRTGGVDMTTVTFGMGARVQAIVGTNLYNRSSMVEARALLKLRTGDREAESENELAAVPGAGGTVTAAELSTIGAEIGVGITIPMGADGGSVFADASLEVGSGSTNINGTVGYRINF